jgi:hypothetical protein
MKGLVEAFAQFSQLPKMLNRKAILETLLDGCRDGLFVFRLPRPEGSFKTFWHERPDELVLKDPTLEVVLPEAIQLTSIATSLLLPDALPELWQSSELMLKDLYSYFSDGRVVKIKRQGPNGALYEDERTIPRAGRTIVDASIQEAIKEKKLWLISGTASFLAEDIPMGVLTDDAYVQLPPQPTTATEILPQTLVEAWQGEVTTALAISHALSAKVGKVLPWITVREAIDGAFRSRLLERTIDSGPWPCDYAGARAVKITVPQEEPTQYSPSATASPLKARETGPQMLTAGNFLEIGEIQNLNDQLSELTKAAVGLNLTFYFRVELGTSTIEQIPEETIAKINALLHEVSDKLNLHWQ